VAPPKTRVTGQPVQEHLASVADPARRADAAALAALIESATGCAPQMWGASIVGYGVHRYQLAGGREGETMAVGFAARSTALVLYGLLDGGAQTASLGPHTTGRGCLYIRSLEHIDTAVLERMAREAFERRSR